MNAFQEYESYEPLPGGICNRKVINALSLRERKVGLVGRRRGVVRRLVPLFEEVAEQQF